MNRDLNRGGTCRLCQGGHGFGPVALLALVLPVIAMAEVKPLIADVVFTNARFVTNDPRMPQAGAVAIRDGKIVAVGTAAEVATAAGTGARKVDLGGRTVLPGFYDNHIHLGGTREDPRIQDWTKIDSKQKLLDALAKRAAAIPAGEWVLGSLDNENLPQARLPTRWEMDKVTPNHPVSMRRGHITLANSMAMKLASIADDTPAPPGGEINRNAKGQPIGWFWEGAGRRMVMRAVPPPAPIPDALAESELKAQLEELLPHGITSLNVAGMRPDTLRWIQNVYAKSGKQLPRTTVQLRLSPGYDSYDDTKVGVATSIKELEDLSFITGFGNDRLKLGAVKMSIDGGFSAAAFLTLEPYPHREEDYFGVERIPADVLYQVGLRAHELGWQLGIHAIGDGAVKMATDVLSRIVTEKPRANHRHFLHHVSVLPPEETMQKMAANHILAASQPNFTYSLGPFNAAPALSPERLQTNNPQMSLIRHNIHVSYGSDGMPIGPLVGIYAAVTRKGVDGKVYGPGERVPVADAVRMYTLEPAYMTFDEKERGSLEPGKVGDLVVLAENILTVAPDRIKDIPVDMTIVGGEVLFDRSKAAPSGAQ